MVRPLALDVVKMAQEAVMCQILCPLSSGPGPLGRSCALASTTGVSLDLRHSTAPPE